MYARVSTYTASPSNADRLVEAFGTDNRLSQMAGIRDAFPLEDRSSGRALTITLRDSEEAMAASAVGATQVRAPERPRAPHPRTLPVGPCYDETKRIRLVSELEMPQSHADRRSMTTIGPEPELARR